MADIINFVKKLQHLRNSMAVRLALHLGTLQLALHSIDAVVANAHHRSGSNVCLTMALFFPKKTKPIFTKPCPRKGISSKTATFATARL